jgi:hypothetical protein
MKKYFAITVAALFLFGVVGMSFAQLPGPEVPKKAPAEQSAPKKGQQMTPEKKAKMESSAPIAEGQAAPSKDKAKTTEKKKKRQAETPDKQKAKDEAAQKGASGK